MALASASILLVLELGLIRIESASIAASLPSLTAHAELQRAEHFPCLPKDVRSDQVVSYGPKGTQPVTVEKKLIEMKARCRLGKLVDPKRREIRFFHPSCWGNPPPDYLEIRQREDNEVAELKKRYAVIVVGCNPMIQ